MITENFEVLRRIAERGLAKSLAGGYNVSASMMVDIFNHMLSEIEVARKAYEEELEHIKRN